VLYFFIGMEGRRGTAVQASDRLPCILNGCKGKGTL